MEPSLHLFMRVFGNELFYRDALPMLEDQLPKSAAEGEEAPSVAEKLIPLLTAPEGLKGTTGRDRQLLHTTVVVPTALGLALRLQLDGVLSTQLTYGVKVDMASSVAIDGVNVPGPALELVFKPRRAAHFLTPLSLCALHNERMKRRKLLVHALRCALVACSAALQVSGRMQVAVGATFVGVRLRGTVHTNSGFKLTAETAKSDETFGVKLNYQMQPQTTEVLNIE